MKRCSKTISTTTIAQEPIHVPCAAPLVRTATWHTQERSLVNQNPRVPHTSCTCLTRKTRKTHRIRKPRRTRHLTRYHHFLTAPNCVRSVRSWFPPPMCVHANWKQAWRSLRSSSAYERSAGVRFSHGDSPLRTTGRSGTGKGWPRRTFFVAAEECE